MTSKLPCTSKNKVLFLLACLSSGAAVGELPQDPDVRCWMNLRRLPSWGGSSDFRSKCCLFSSLPYSSFSSVPYFSSPVSSTETPNANYVRTHTPWSRFHLTWEVTLTNQINTWRKKVFVALQKSILDVSAEDLVRKFHHKWQILFKVFS